ncbi:phage shock protein PspC (stress-responsive transcriptional regulator) [Variovorax boronicumulans]|uniref:major capsid protein n=1 Tax=Variovorax boronicumulans TaxID=436515 RepID=UPI00278880A0|nr:major capsid protein [Variovorax boronicumulans]MDP9911882.1 phage shock protein PspC (stress-responsive transcriptional regulator) [Variovorax boronicumulans]
MKKFASYVKRGLAPVVVGAGALSVLPARAAIDVSGVVAKIAEYSGVDSPIVEIGGAILLVVLTIAALVWVRRSLK